MFEAFGRAIDEIFDDPDLKEKAKELGRSIVEFGETNGLQFIHGKLNIGQAMAPPVIRAVKKYINPTRISIIDAPPGTSCPVIESIRISNFCILVTEPTPFGLNDLTLAVEVLRKIGKKILCPQFDDAYLFGMD